MAFGLSEKGGTDGKELCIFIQFIQQIYIEHSLCAQAVLEARDVFAFISLHSN